MTFIASSPGKVRILPQDVIGRIAAGEVVERPAAVVKELIDNSLDAGSAHIQIEVADGGRGLIRVTDDGEGMSRPDATLAFERHATSKLRDDQDLLRIETMGFRGEALPSIAAVSKVRVTTARRHDPVGTRLTLAGGRLDGVEDAPSAPGTQVEVSDLFFNTPARRKFLKTPGTEFSHICLAVQHAALAHPAIHVGLTHNGQAVFDYPTVGSLRDRVLQVYGPGLLGQLTNIAGEQGSVRVEGFAVHALHAKTGRTPQELFVNRRPVKSPTVSHAIYDGYGVSLPKGRHPVFVLFLQIDPTRVDVNVHPTKREVRLADQDLVHQFIRQTVRRAVGGASPAASQITSLNGSAILSESAGRGEREPALDGWTGPSSPTAPLPGFGGLSGPIESAEPGRAYGFEGDVVPLGQLRQTFMVAQVGSELQIIDQHTAHERVLFERLWRASRAQSVPSQPLLIPHTVELPSHQTVLLRQHLGELAYLGLEMEPFGANAFVIRAVPSVVGAVEYDGLVQDVLEDLAQWNTSSSMEARIKPVLASMACHSAVRAGRSLQPLEMKQLIEDWIEEGFPATCPHGRRIALRLPEDELLRMFGRL